jgi:DNA primase
MKLEELAKYLELSKVKIRGAEINASCPFPEQHLSGTDKHPSFFLNPEKGVYNCFSCGSRGTIEELVSKLKHVSLSEALSILEGMGYNRIALILKAKEANDYPEILPEGILYYFDRVDDEIVELYRGEVDGQDCLVYPVRNRNGDLVGALARSIEGRWHKIMWNMNKKRYLYGENTIRAEAPIVIVEGPGDVAAVKRAGIKNVVALMGAALYDEQVEKLLHMSSKLIVWLDRDKAGAKGINQCIRKLDKRATVRYVDPWSVLPEGTKDAKEVYEKFGAEAVQYVIEEAKTFLEQVMEHKCATK